MNFEELVRPLAEHVDLVSIHRLDQGFARGEVPVEGPDADARVAGDVFKGHIGAPGREGLGGGGDQQIAVADRVGTGAPIGRNRLSGLDRLALSHRDITCHHWITMP